MPILHPPGVEVRCKLQEKMHHVTKVAIKQKYVHTGYLQMFDISTDWVTKNLKKIFTKITDIYMYRK